MKRTIDLDQVRVVQADNYKGNSRVYLEIMDERVLYSDPNTLAADPALSGYVNSVTYTGGPYATPDLIVDTDALADLFRRRLAAIFARLLREQDPELLAAWDTTTDREIDYVKPRLAEDPDA